MSQITGPVFSIFGVRPTMASLSGDRPPIKLYLRLMQPYPYPYSMSNKLPFQQLRLLETGILLVQGFGVFAGRANQLAVYGYSANGTQQWNYYAPINGLVAYETSTTYTWVYQTSTASWVPKPVASTAYIIPNVGTMSGSTITVTGGSPNQVIDTIDKLTFSSAKYTIQTKYTTNYQVTELLVTSDGTIAQYTEYAKLKSNLDLGTFSAAISGNNIQLLFSPSNSGTMTLRIMRTAIYI